MFCHITENWRGRPLVSHEVIVNLIGNTTTKTGLTIQAELDTSTYPTGIRVSEEELAQVCIEKAEFHGEWTIGSCPDLNDPTYFCAAPNGSGWQAKRLSIARIMPHPLMAPTLPSEPARRAALAELAADDQ